MAFGTGTHETTSMCAMLLEKYTNKGETGLLMWDVEAGFYQ